MLQGILEYSIFYFLQQLTITPTHIHAHTHTHMLLCQIGTIPVKLINLMRKFHTHAQEKSLSHSPSFPLFPFSPIKLTV